MESKQSKMPVLKLVLLVSVLGMTRGADWCYKSQVSCDNHCKGPDEWKDVEPKCGSKKQSPINIVTKRVVSNNLTPFRLQGYQHAFESVFTNNGHTVKLELSGEAVIDGAGLGGPYKAMEVHFHWGKNGGPGSEHTIDGEQYPMEMHIVHIKKIYNSVKDALNDSSGIAVLGFLYEESDSENKKYDSIIKALANISKPGSNTTIQHLSLEMLISSHDTLNHYFRYNGSLTTPGCAESVVWTVFVDTIKLDKKQLSTFSNLTFEDGSAMTDTFRPVQPLNSRPVFYSGSNIASFSTVLVVNTLIITFLSL